MATASELLTEDARSRFSHTKALFEQLERQHELPSFYSPRPQRNPPPLPPKPQLTCPSSPLSQVSRNFEQLATDLERIKTGRAATTVPPTTVTNNNHLPPSSGNNNGSSSSELSTYGRPLSSSSSGGSTSTSPHGRSSYEPYWRDASFYKRRFDDTDVSGDTRYALVQSKKDEEEEEEQRAERDERGLRITPQRSGMYNEGPIATMRGLSPERPCDIDPDRKISFSTAPIMVYGTHSVDDYDRKNDDIDPVASCAEYELERRLERMDLFEVELDKGTEGLGVSIIGMGVGADSGLEKLGIFVKSITPEGAVHRDGRIRVCDQIVSVDGISLVGVSQKFAADSLKATVNRVRFVIGREQNLEDSEVAALIRQSLDTDRKMVLPEEDEEEYEEDDAPPPCQPPPAPHFAPPPIIATPVAPSSANLSSNGRPMSHEESEIRAKIAALELEVELSQKKADQMHRQTFQMHNVLDTTKEHYTLLEKKYEQANALLRNYQEREKELLSREENHVEQLKEKDAHYANLVSSLKTRIDELEERLEEMAQKRANIAHGELTELRQRLGENFGNDVPPPLPTAQPPASHSEISAYRPGGDVIHEDKAVMAKVPLPSRANSKRDAEVNTNGWTEDARSVMSSSCDSPVPRVSEPASPALPHKFSGHRRLLFPLRKRYALSQLQNESEFWRASYDQIQGLQVLHWSVDDICQLLVSMGLDKYIPEMTINKINGVKFLELDSNKLKTMGIQNHSDRSLIKKKIKMIKVRIERERKMLEKESRARAHAAHAAMLTQSIPI